MRRSKSSKSNAFCSERARSYASQARATCCSRNVRARSAYALPEFPSPFAREIAARTERGAVSPMPSDSRMRLSALMLSSLSQMLKSRANPPSAWNSRKSRTPSAWNVATRGMPWPSGTSDRMRSRISLAALFVKVTVSIRWADTPCSIRWVTRWAMVLVFPAPAPATMRRGPSVCKTACFWAVFKAFLSFCDGTCAL